uniref:Uncharacterized protein n=1 Tax=Cacopsylla melanoneura TaxID=428564 RepID=A0A8D8RKX7_9HEMI
MLLPFVEFRSAKPNQSGGNPPASVNNATSQYSSSKVDNVQENPNPGCQKPAHNCQRRTDSSVPYYSNNAQPGSASGTYRQTCGAQPPATSAPSNCRKCNYFVSSMPPPNAPRFPPKQAYFSPPSFERVDSPYPGLGTSELSGSPLWLSSTSPNYESFVTTPVQTYPCLPFGKPHKFPSCSRFAMHHASGGKLGKHFSGALGGNLGKLCCGALGGKLGKHCCANSVKHYCGNMKACLRRVATCRYHPY